MKLKKLKLRCGDIATIPKGWAVVKSGRTKKGDRTWNTNKRKFSTPEGFGFSVDNLWCAIRRVRKTLSEQRIDLLMKAFSELRRLQGLLLPRYEGKLGEPNPALIKKIEKFLFR